MISVTDLGKRFDDIIALESVTFTLEPGTFTVLIGPSGAGKTTLLRCVNGLERPDRGRIEIDGNPLDPRAVAMIFQHDALVNRKRALETVLDGSLGREPAWRELLSWHTVEERRAALERLHAVGLAGYAERRVGDLSGGERQRVGIARALQQEPIVLLADEPVAALDPTTARSVIERIAAVVRENDLYGFVSIHQPELAAPVADRFLGLRAGRIVLDQPVSTVETADIAQVYNG